MNIVILNKGIMPTLFRNRKHLSLRLLGNYGWKLVRSVIVLGICFLILYPLLIKLMVSIKSEADLFDPSVVFIPRIPSVENIKLVWNSLEYPRSFFNSIVLSLLTSLLQLCSCTVIGYGFARFRFKGRGILFSLVIITMVIPPQTIMAPLFLHFRYFDVFNIISLITGKHGVNLLDTFWPFTLMSATGMGLKNGLYIYIIRQFFRGMPRELEEAACVDGAGIIKTFYKIMLPSAMPAMVTVFLFSFVWQWTDTFYSSLFLQDLKVLPIALGTVVNNMSKTSAGATVILSPILSSAFLNIGSLMLIIPLIIIYLAAQRSFVESIERSGVVG